MKKLLASVLAVGILFQMTVSADVLDEAVELLSEEYTSATVNFEMSYELNKPMDFLGEMQKYYEEQTDYQDSNPIDFQLMAESFLDSASNVTVKLNAAEDFKKMDVHMQGDFSLPVKANDDLKITGDMSFGIWISTDFTNDEDFRYEVTMKGPFSRKYIHLDCGKMLREASMLAKNLGHDTGWREESREKSKELLRECLKDTAEIDRKDSGYIIKFDNDGIIVFVEKFFAGTIDMIKDLTGKYPDAGFSEAFPDEAFEIPEEMKEIIESIKKLKFLGEKGLVIEIEKSFGKISDLKVSCDFDINIYDILVTFKQEVPEFITKENSYISFLAKYDYVYSDIGSTTVTFPELDKDNCIDMSDVIEEGLSGDFENDYDGYDNAESEYFNGSSYGLVVRGPFEHPYIALRGTVENYAVDVSNYEYTYSDEIEILWDNGIITINDTKKMLPFNSAVLNSLTDEIFVDGIKIELPESEQKHILIKEGTTYVSPELAKAFIGAQVTDYSIDFSGDGMISGAWVYFDYPNPNYIPVTYQV